MQEYVKIPVESLKKYFDTRCKKNEEGEYINTGSYPQQVLGESGVNRLGRCWEEYGEDFEYLRQILEYDLITDESFTKEEQALVRKVSKRQNIFLADCFEELKLKKQYDEAVVIEEK